MRAWGLWWGMGVLATVGGCERALSGGSNDVAACGAGATVSQMPLPGPAPVVGETAAFQPYHIIAGPDGNLWMTEVWDKAIGRLTTDGRHDRFPLAEELAQDPQKQLEGMTVGPDGNIWFAEPGPAGCAIGRITPDGQITDFPLTSSYRWPYALTVGADGNIWFSDPTANAIGSIGLDGALRSERFFSSTGNWLDAPYALVRGPDGNLWFGEATRLGWLTPQVDFGFYVRAEVPGDPQNGFGSPRVAAPGGDLWGLATTNGMVARFRLPGGAGGGPEVANFAPPGFDPAVADSITAMTVGPDGNVWYASGDKIGCVNASGAIHTIPLPQPGYVFDLTLGPDGALWFTEPSFDRVGRISVN